MNISSSFDGGNIEVRDASDPTDVHLAIRPDNASDFHQWFSFRAAGQRGTPWGFRIVNAGTTSYPAGWEGYRVASSTDRVRWRRLDATYAGGELRWSHTPDADVCWYAYFAPYSLERHADLLARCAASAQVIGGVGVNRLGVTVDGRDLDRVTVGTGSKVAWVIARQHPGETMAEWWIEGFLGRLLDPTDALARGLLRDVTFHVVPNMNPDGSFRGNLRTNAAGANLNREWHAPTVERSPEVFAVRAAMDASGVDLCLDVHGDEDLPYNFIAGAEGVAGFTPEMSAQLDRFKADYQRANPDFQTVQGNPRDAPGEANLTLCTPQIAHRFKCLSMTLEMPFKDTADDPDVAEGWSPQRAMRLGASALDPIRSAL
ncbi:MAG: carboxypeptidase family protein [Deltaproteobacteria bacterium]|nr:carboxypeptidase family protein [Deltaproteobacteria bacterium]